MREASAPRTSHNYYPIFRMEFLCILKFGGCQICIKTGFLLRSRFLEGIYQLHFLLLISGVG